MSIPKMDKNETVNCTVKVRYGHKGQPARLVLTEKDKVKITFDQPVRAAAPGQSAVFYDDGGYVIGGGIITEVLGQRE
jgi:tRNA-specific 2-thiouridylase